MKDFIARCKDKNRPYLFGVGGRMVISLTIMFTIITLISSVTLMFTKGYSFMVAELDRDYDACEFVAKLVNADELLGYLKTERIDARYKEISKRLVQAVVMHDRDDELYIYTLGEDDTVVQIFGIRDGISIENEFLKKFEVDHERMEKFRSNSDDENDRGSDTRLKFEYITNDSDNTLNNTITWYPIYDDNNKAVGIVVISESDIKMGKELMKNLGHPFRNCTILFIILMLLIIWRMNSTVLKPTKQLTEYVASYENGEFKKSQPEFKNKNEITFLSDSFSEMASKIETYIESSNQAAKDAEHVATEMGIARGIQYSMLNSEFPAFPKRKEFDLHAFMHPAAYVGGDFYDFFFIDDDHLTLVIADVSGGSVSGAMFMMRAITNIKDWAKVLKDPADILKNVNNELCSHNAEGMFVTVWIGILDIRTGHMICSNGGHEYPFVQKNNGEFETLYDDHGLVLGGLEDVDYTNYEIILNKGESVFVYTDGVAECFSETDEQFGMDRVLDVLNSSVYIEGTKEYAPVKTIDDNMFAALQKHMGSKPQYDDITMLCIRYLGSGEGE